MQHFMLQIHQHTNDGTLHTSLIIANIKHEVRMDEFLRMAAGLKKIPRQGWIDKAGISNPESVADHSYSMTVMAMMFGDNAGMDTCKMIRMALLHDIVESITGDLTPEMTSKENKLAQFAELVQVIMIQMKLILGLNMKSWKDAKIRTRITNISLCPVASSTI